MRILLFEHQFMGHYFHYLSYILPELATLVDEVIVALTRRGYDSVEYRTLLAPLSDRVDFRPIVPHGDPSLRLSSRVPLHRDLRDAVRSIRPDYVLVPSGDGETSAMGLYRALRLGALPGGIPGEAGIHYGYGPGGTRLKDRLKDVFYLQTQKYSGWRRIHYANVLVYEWARSRGGPLGRSAELMPHPVPANPRRGKVESRRQLGIPEEGRYIGLVAELDRRKAVDHLLAAFRAVTGRDERLVLAGRLHPDFDRLIAEEYADLVDGGRIIVRNHYIDKTTSDLLYDALDVACMPYPGFGVLSSAMLHGIAAGRPVLVNDFGWMRAMVRRFGFGWACDVLDPAAFRRTMRMALDRCEDYRESEATRRLLEFHDPANFTECWTAGIREAMGRPRSERIRTWSWVLDEVDEERRALN